MPPGRRDAVTADRQGKQGDRAGRRVGAEQLPLPGHDQADQDHERQHHDRNAVRQIHQIGLGRGQHPDDPRDRFFEVDPLVSGDQRAGDDEREEHRGEHDPQDVVGPAGQWMQQAARNGDLPSVNPHLKNHRGSGPDRSAARREAPCGGTPAVAPYTVRKRSGKATYTSCFRDRTSAGGHRISAGHRQERWPADTSPCLCVRAAARCSRGRLCSPRFLWRDSPRGAA